MNQPASNAFIQKVGALVAAELQNLSLQHRLSELISPTENRDYLVVTIGKAAEFLFSECEKVFGNSIKKGLVLSPYPAKKAISKRADFYQTDHPIPGKNSAKATAILIEALSDCSPQTLVIFGVSGGSSASLALPKEGLKLEDLSDLNTFFMRAGLPISTMNTIRSAVSDVKGGQLLSFLPSHCDYVGFHISDVPGDDLSVIGSGPTVPNKIDVHHVLEILNSVKGWPEKVEGFLRTQFTGLDTTSYPDNNHLALSPKIFAENVAHLLNNKGLKPRKLKELRGNVAEVSQQILENLPKSGEVDIYFGETTVDVIGKGKGGRNQDLALRLGEKFYRDNLPYTAICFGTDGVDGPTDAAGAWCSAELIDEALEKNLDPNEFLANSDSYHFFQNLGKGHLITGPTGHNLMDILIVF